MFSQNQQLIESKQQSYGVTSPERFSLRQMCNTHQDEFLTNFCCNLDCLKPLCPDCIDSHVRLHQDRGEFPGIDSLKVVKQNCEKKLKQGKLSLSQYQDAMEQKNQLVAPDFVDEGILQINRARDKLIDIINQYFDSMIQKYNESLQTFSTHGNEVNNFLEKMRNYQNELELLHANLEGPNCINAIKQICLLDLGQTLKKFKKEIQTLDDQRNIYSMDVIIDDRRIGFIQSELLRYSMLGSVHTIDQKPVKPVFNLEDNPIPTTNEMNNQFNQFQTMQGPVSSSKKKNQDDDMQYKSEQHQKSDRSSRIPTDQRIPTITQIQSKIPPTQLIIKQNDYFDSDCRHKCLHFFNYLDNVLNILDLQKINDQLNNSQNALNPIKFDQYQLKPVPKIYQFHKSIITPRGWIFVIGGDIPSYSETNSQIQQNQKINQQPNSNNSSQIHQDQLKKSIRYTKSKDVFFYNFQHNILEKRQDMLFARSSHSLCYLNGYIYAIGGYIDGQNESATCERYSIDHNKWTQIANMNSECVSCALATFNDQLIFRFGGHGRGATINIMEVYNINRDIWERVDAKFNPENSPRYLKKNFKLLDNSCSIQVNPSEIFVFGGYMENQQKSQVGQNSTFVMRIEEDNQAGIDFDIRSVNARLLTFAEGFWNNNPIVYNNQIFCLQNVSEEGTDIVIAGMRRVLVFGGQEWSVIPTQYQ